MAKKYDRLFKVLLLGDSGAGKHSIVHRFRDPDLADTFIPTIGVDFIARTIDIDGVRVKLQVWDTAAQERFHTITTAYYRGAVGFLLVYDVRNKDSFDHISRWLSDIDEHAAREDICKILVGHFNEDVDCKTVTTGEAQAFAEQHGLQLFEISSKDSAQVEEMFHALARMMVQTVKDQGMPASAVTVPEGNSSATESKCSI